MATATQPISQKGKFSALEAHTMMTFNDFTKQRLIEIIDKSEAIRKPLVIDARTNAFPFGDINQKEEYRLTTEITKYFKWIQGQSNDAILDTHYIWYPSDCTRQSSTSYSEMTRKCKKLTFNHHFQRQTTNTKRYKEKDIDGLSYILETIKNYREIAKAKKKSLSGNYIFLSLYLCLYLCLTTKQQFDHRV